MVKRNVALLPQPFVCSVCEDGSNISFQNICMCLPNCAAWHSNHTAVRHSNHTAVRHSSHTVVQSLTPRQNQNYRLCHSTYVIRRMRMLIVTSVILFARCAMLCSNALRVRLSVRIVVDLDSHRGTLIVRRASCGDWTGPPSMTDGGHVAISCSSELPNPQESQTSNSSQKFIAVLYWH